VIFDLGHFAHRFVEPFNSESRFYWPAVIALAIALVANIVWYYLPPKGVAPVEHAARPWAFWINAITLILVAVFLMAKAPFLLTALVFGLDLAALVYLYGVYVPPLEAEWLRERRRAKYLPKPKRRRRR
jgi:drug/metabolite transporter (DMT)-like permease